MELAAKILQVVIALGIYNVWFLRFGKSTNWRGGDAKNLRDEFAVYGLPAWFMIAIGVLKISLASLLLAGLFFPSVARPAAVGMAILMLGAVLMHLKVKDPLKRALPATTLLALSIYVAIVQP